MHFSEKSTETPAIGDVLVAFFSKTFDVRLKKQCIEIDFLIQIYNSNFFFIRITNVFYVTQRLP